MAATYTCDRCDRKLTNPPATMTGTGPGMTTPKDFCPDCWDAVVDFMNKRITTTPPKKDK
jgi:hypothetical protein